MKSLKTFLKLETINKLYILCNGCLQITYTFLYLIYNTAYLSVLSSQHLII